jgi:hypothetical protein
MERLQKVVSSLVFIFITGANINISTIIFDMLPGTNITLIRNGTAWTELHRSVNGAN